MKLSFEELKMICAGKKGVKKIKKVHTKGGGGSVKKPPPVQRA